MPAPSRRAPGRESERLVIKAGQRDERSLVFGDADGTAQGTAQGMGQHRRSSLLLSDQLSLTQHRPAPRRFSTAASAYARVGLPALGAGGSTDALALVAQGSGALGTAILGARGRVASPGHRPF